MFRAIANVLIAAALGIGSQFNLSAVAGETATTAIRAVPSAPCDTCLLFVNEKIGRFNNLHNPLYTLKAYKNGQLIYTFDAVAGRWNTQTRDRHRGGTEAPLPDGSYQVASRSVPGTISEVGGKFLPIHPLFQTGRTALGIHYDPNYNKPNGEDGTSGCIGLTNQADFEQILNFIKLYHPQTLIVDLQ
ncbi:MAG: L,D-transpeptidase [Hydrococcus sp. RM1_1_31]|nr:L,D-transpeptidase [Hydrococcus sp. RM1_1_31]